jgi:CheY-like chemotaxis protein
MRLEFDQNVSTVPFTESGVSENARRSSSMSAQELLQTGIKAAQEGRRVEARQNLLRVTELEPKNENAWLWLASISEYPEELMVFLNNVLDVNPHNERAAEWMKATKSLLANTFVQRGIGAAKDNQTSFARQSFYQAIAHDSQNEMAWLWLASIADSADEKQTYLEKVLEINPENPTALEVLKNAREESAQALLKKANSAAFAGELDAANDLLDEALKKSPELEDAWLLKSHLTDSFGEKIKCFEKILEINPSHEAARAGFNSLSALMKTMEPKPAAENPAALFCEEFSREDQSSNENDFGSNQFSEEFLPASPTEELEFPQQIAQENYFPAEEKTEDESHAELAEEEEAIITDVSVIEETAQEEAREETHETEPVGDFVDFGRDFGAAQADFEDRTEKSENDFAFFEETPDVFAAESKVDFDEKKNELEPNMNFEKEVFELDLAQPEDAAPAFERAGESFFPQIEALPAVDLSELEQSAQENNFYQENNFEQNGSFAGNISDEVNDYAAGFNSPTQPAFEANNAQPFEERSAEKEEIREYRGLETNAEYSFESKSGASACPFCTGETNAQAFSCLTCGAVLSLSDMETLLANQNADAEMLRSAVSRMEAEETARYLGEEELVSLGVAHINMKNLRQGFSYLQKASQMNPNNVLLSSQVNALAIRLEEIERKEEMQESQPQNRKILVVDDSPTVRKLISGKLEKSGHEVFCAADGMDALAKLSEVVPDLILLDINMPRMDGYQVCKMIRNNPQTKDIPVVMISGKDGFFDKVRGRMAGTTGYITKPFGPETLMKALDVYIKHEEVMSVTPELQ